MSSSKSSDSNLSGQNAGISPHNAGVNLVPAAATAFEGTDDPFFIVCWPFGEAEQAVIKNNPSISRDSLRNNVVTAVAVSSAVCATAFLLMSGYLSYWPVVVAGVLVTTFIGCTARDTSTPAYIRLTESAITFEYAAIDTVDTIPWRTIVDVKLQVSPMLERFGKGDQITIRREVNTKNGKEVLPFFVKASAVRTRENWLKIERHMEKLGLKERIFVDPRIVQAMRPDERTPSYTELWLEALNAPPEREKLGPLLNGHQLQKGRLTIVRAIGAGGQGRTYLAVFQRGSSANSLDEAQRTVVLKEYILPVFIDGTARKQALAEFNHEAEMMKSCKSEHIVEMHEYFVEDQRGYLVLEYIQGEDLRKLVKRDGPLAPEKVVELMIQMCDALAHLHGLTPPIVHRDFTPENLMLDGSGKLKLIDFTAAQLEKNDGEPEVEVVGKREYIPPEQFRGRANRQSDIYSLGCTAYFLLTGKDPEALKQSTMEDEGALTEIEKQLSAVVSRATALDPTRRYRSVEELSAQLHSLLTSR